MGQGGAIRNISLPYPFVPSYLRVVLLLLMPLRKKFKLLFWMFCPLLSLVESSGCNNAILPSTESKQAT